MFFIDGETVDSWLWALIKRAAERDAELHTTSDVVDAHLAVVAEMLGTFILTSDPDDMTRLEARYERY